MQNGADTHAPLGVIPPIFEMSVPGGKSALGQTDHKTEFKRTAATRRKDKYYQCRCAVFSRLSGERLATPEDLVKPELARIVPNFAHLDRARINRAGLE